jgi:hypothetical protein
VIDRNDNCNRLGGSTKIFLKKLKYFFYFKLIIFLIFLNYVLILKIIFKI